MYNFQSFAYSCAAKSSIHVRDKHRQGGIHVTFKDPEGTRALYRINPNFRGVYNYLTYFMFEEVFYKTTSTSNVSSTWFFAQVVSNYLFEVFIRDKHLRKPTQTWNNWGWPLFNSVKPTNWLWHSKEIVDKLTLTNRYMFLFISARSHNYSFRWVHL